MSTRENWRNNIVFVLVEPRESGNIGAAARAIKNMGFGTLRLVNPPATISEEAGWFAHGAQDVLDRAERFQTMKEAVADSSLVVGTTRRTGKKRRVFIPFDETISRIVSAAQGNRVAVLFGRETKGLSNAEIEQCGLLLRIATAPEQPSLNIAQAVLIVAYELMKAGFGPPQEQQAAALVPHAQLDALYGRIAKTLKLIDYVARGDRDLESRIMLNLRHFIGRAGLAPWELRMLQGIIGQVDRKVKARHSSSSPSAGNE